MNTEKYQDEYGRLTSESALNDFEYMEWFSTVAEEILTKHKCNACVVSKNPNKHNWKKPFLCACKGTNTAYGYPALCDERCGELWKQYQRFL